MNIHLLSRDALVWLLKTSPFEVAYNADIAGNKAWYDGSEFWGGYTESPTVNSIFEYRWQFTGPSPSGYGQGYDAKVTLNPEQFADGLLAGIFVAPSLGSKLGLVGASNLPQSLVRFSVVSLVEEEVATTPEIWSAFVKTYGGTPVVKTFEQVLAGLVRLQIIFSKSHSYSQSAYESGNWRELLQSQHCRGLEYWDSAASGVQPGMGTADTTVRIYKPWYGSDFSSPSNLLVVNNPRRELWRVEGNRLVLVKPAPPVESAPDLEGRVADLERRVTDLELSRG